MNRRAFVKSGLLFVPTLLLPRKSLGQFASFNDQAFMSQGSSSSSSLNNGLQLGWEMLVDTGTPIPDVSPNGFSATDCNPSRHSESVGGQIGINYDDQWSFLKSIRLYTADDAKLRGGSGQSFTYCGWFYPHGDLTRQAGAPIICKWGSTNEWWCGFDDGVGTMHITIRNLANSANVSCTPGVVSGVDAWCFILGGYDDAAQQVFGYLGQGGTLGSKQTTSSTGARSDTNEVSAGNYSGTPCGNSVPLDGWLGPVYFWNRALSGSEVTRLYNGGTMLRKASW